MTTDPLPTLGPGDRLGAYEILASLGAGGMGVVYRAHDRRLGRQVAMKVLTARLARAPDALARFEREARAIAALSHPNILAIHDFGADRGVVYSVTELLEGETLRERIARAPLPWRKACEIGAAIADALAAAHAKRIIHRDLKPENVFLTSDGRVKVLDFGLAQQELATLTEGDTSDGLILSDPGTLMGTVPYMSPEQVRGELVDARSDIFSLGGILYEMVTGEGAFARPTAPETMAAVLKEDPPRVSGSGRQMPYEADRLIFRCLEKSPEERFQSARDLAFALRGFITEAGFTSEAVVRPPVSPPLATGRRNALRALAAVALLSAAFAAGLARRSPAPEPPRLRTLTYSGHDSSPAASPDSRMLAFTSDRDGRRRIWLKQLVGAAEAPLTTGPDDFARFSPDGASVLFSTREGERALLARVPTLGGQARRLVEDAQDGDWSPDGRRVAFTRWTRAGEGIDSAVGVVAAEGGEPRLLATIRGQTLLHPRWSPDGRTIAVVENGQSPRLLVFLIAAEGGSVRQVAPAVSGGHLSSVVWSADGRALVFARTESVAVGHTGSPARVVRQDLASGAGRTLLWIPSRSEILDGLAKDRLVFEFRSQRQNLQEASLARRAASAGRWLTRGNSTDRQPVYSPDGEWVAFTSNRDGNLDVWKVSTQTGAIERLTEHPSEDWDPAFTADGSRLLFSSNRSRHFEIWIAQADGSRPRQVTNDGFNAQNPTATPDGGWIVYTSVRPDRSGLYKVRADGSQTTRIVAQAALWPEVSPDGRLVVYTTVESGRHVVRIARTEDGAPVQFEIPVERGGEGRGRWMPDGRALAFTGVDESGATGVYVQDFAQGRDTAATRRRLAGFDRDYVSESFGLARDGSRITIAGSEQLWSLMAAEGIRE